MPLQLRFACFAVSVISLGGCFRDISPPRIEFSATDIDLGRVAVSSEPREIRFRFVNAGGTDLRVTRLGLSCTCTNANVSEHTIVPLAEADVLVRVMASESGRHSASVDAFSNDPANPQVRLTLTWEGVAQIAADPSEPDFGRVRPGAISRHVVKLKSEGTDAASLVKDVAAMPEGVLSAQLSPAGDLVIDFTAPDRKDPAAGLVILTFNGDEQTSLHVPVRWRVQDVIEAVPPKLLLGVGAPGTALRRDVLLLSDGAQLEVGGVTIDGLPGASTQMRREAEDKIILTVESTLPERSGPMDGTVRIECVAPERRTILVPVSAFVTENVAVTQEAGAEP